MGSGVDILTHGPLFPLRPSWISDDVGQSRYQHDATRCPIVLLDQPPATSLEVSVDRVILHFRCAEGEYAYVHRTNIPLLFVSIVCGTAPP
jgi:hypothetical protein